VVVAYVGVAHVTPRLVVRAKASEQSSSGD